MNKIKLMLTAIVVLSTVGGVLAFKTMGPFPICTTATKSNGNCGNGTPQNPFTICGFTPVQETPGGLAAFVCTTITDFAIECGDSQNPLPCPVRTRTVLN